MARNPGQDAIYQVADFFRDRCITDDRSLLWPDARAWTLENLNAFWDAFVNHPDTGGESFTAKWGVQLRNERDEIFMIASDLAAFYGLFPSRSSMGAQSKTRLVRETLALRPELPDPDDEAWSDLMAAFEVEGLGSSGQHYLTGRPFHIGLYLGFVRALKARNVDLSDIRECRILVDEIKEEIKSAMGHWPYLGRNILLHLLFPDEFESIASDDHKRRIFDALIHKTELPASTDLDEGILAIRKVLMQELDRDPFWFYDPDVRAKWDTTYRQSPVPKVADEAGGRSQPAVREAGELITFEDLENEVYLDGRELQGINDLLCEKRQLIFEGPPGSGKTFVAEKFARWFTGQPLDADIPLNEQVEIVQFHQSYGYEDFVQGIRPGMNDDKQLVYHVRDGIFLKMCERAASNPDLPFVLIIDEINRGNISRIFGELLLLLEYRHMTARLPHGDGDQGTLRIPENLYIIGTMNTADRSLAQIDYALRRRFYFVRFMPVENGRAPVFERWLATQDMSGEDRIRLADLFVALNHAIRDRLYTDDLQVGHSYFMTPQIATDAGFDRVWTRAVQPLLVEYLHHHRDRDEILASLQPEALMAVPSTETNISPDDQDAP